MQVDSLMEMAQTRKTLGEATRKGALAKLDLRGRSVLGRLTKKC